MLYVSDISALLAQLFKQTIELELEYIERSPRVKLSRNKFNNVKVKSTWTMMKQNRVKLNSVSYGCMLDACVKCHHVDAAIEIFNEMKKLDLHKNTVSINLDDN